MRQMQLALHACSLLSAVALLTTVLHSLAEHRTTRESAFYPGSKVLLGSDLSS
jgi:hypothetical protein